MTKEKWNVSEKCDLNCQDFWLWECSSCGFKFSTYDYKEPVDAGFYHCPWCGTRLVDPDEDEKMEINISLEQCNMGGAGR